MDHVPQKFSEKVLSFIKVKDRDLILAEITNWTPTMWFAARFTAQAHGIGPHLNVIFNDYQLFQILDNNFHRYIQDQYVQNKKRISRIQEILHTLLSKANDQNIPLMPLKGSILINDYYSDPAIRPMADIDLLIYPEDYDRLDRLLESMQFHPFDSFDDGVYSNVHHLVSIDGEHPDNPIKIEMSHRVGWPIGRLEFDITELIWENAEKGFLGYDCAYKPTQERLLLMLICHNAGNQFNGKMRAFQLYDISLVSKRMNAQQWSNLKTIVKENQLQRIVFPVLAMAKRFTDIEVPDGLIEEQKLHTPHALKHHVQNQSVDSLIASNDYKLLNLKLNERSHKKNRNVLKIYQPFFITIVQAMQLQWLFPGKEKRQQLKHNFSLSTYKKDREGNLTSYILYYRLLLPIVFFPVLVIGEKQRSVLLGKLRLSLIKNLFESTETA